MIDLAAAKQHLRVVGTDEDALIQRCIDAATLNVHKYCGGDLLPVSPTIDAAILLIVGELYESRESGGIRTLAMLAAENLVWHHMQDFGI